ncbi:homoserine O-acetyltransferase MetX [Rhodocyclus tenuis]|uniref:homoserine O-acetyltransferase MetX n=1 Tax=Rhodocyclus tenuis TaxID=1066 RepID=UPI0019085A7A|nr:homoserine O-acetyltransferase [Rhodocyclus tenuis]
MTAVASEGSLRRLALRQPFALESGERIPGLEIAYRSWGRLSPQGDNAIVVCHALTGNADADCWWSPLFGAGRALDPEKHFIICSNTLGGCYGTTGPTSIAPDGRPWGKRFPRISIRDQVRAQIALADALGIAHIRCVIGGSMGGLQALEWALLDPERTGAIVSIAAAARHSPWCIVWSEAQRLALRADPRFRDGDYAPDAPPRDGLAAARAIAMVSYRSAQSLDERFGRCSGGEVFGDRSRSPDDFAAQCWLRHHAHGLVERFDANTYLRLIDAMDTHDVALGRGDHASVLGQIRQPALIGSINSDALYVPADQRFLAAQLPHAELLEIDSAHGHDGFLIDAENFEPAIRRFIEQLPARQATPAAHDCAANDEPQLSGLASLLQFSC